MLKIDRLAYIASVVVEEVLASSKNIEKMEGRKGVYVCVADLDGTPHAVISVLEPPSREKRRKYCEIAQKKCYDLSLLRDHMSTTRGYGDDELDRYTGAIVGSKYIFATSGYTGNLDEVCSLGIAVGMGDISRERAMEIGCDNPAQAILRRVLDVLAGYGP